MTDETPTPNLPTVKPKPAVWVPNSFKAMQTMADVILKSGLAPEAFTKPEAIIIALQMGAELGLLPMQSLRMIHVIKNRPVVSAAGKVAIVMASGKAEYFFATKVSAEAATWTTKRRGTAEPVSYTFTMAQANAAGLPARNPTYKSFPERMLSARAKSFLADDVYADVVGGLATVEELQDGYEVRAALDTSVPIAQALTQEIRATLEKNATETLDGVNGEAPVPVAETQPLAATRHKCEHCGNPLTMPHKRGCKVFEAPAREPGQDDR